MDFKQMDALNQQILDILKKDGRASYSDIGAQTGLSRVAVKNRIRSMENTGIIKGYQAVIAPAEFPDTTAFVLDLEASADVFEEARRVFSEMPEVLYLVQTTGECHLTGIVVVRNIVEMRQIVNSTSRKIPGIRRLTAHTILDHIKGELISDR